MSDTLNSLIKTLEKIPDNGIEYINKVDLFYNSAWNKLVLVGSVAFQVAPPVAALSLMLK